MNLSDTLVSIIRTVIPAAWGTLLSWAILQFPALEIIEGHLSALEEVLTLVVIGLWYSATRVLEPRLPKWLRKIFFGVDSAPDYETHLGV